MNERRLRQYASSRREEIDHITYLFKKYVTWHSFCVDQNSYIVNQMSVTYFIRNVTRRYRSLKLCRISNDRKLTFRYGKKTTRRFWIHFRQIKKWSIFSVRGKEIFPQSWNAIPLIHSLKNITEGSSEINLDEKRNDQSTNSHWELEILRCVIRRKSSSWIFKVHQRICVPCSVIDCHFLQSLIIKRLIEWSKRPLGYESFRSLTKLEHKFDACRSSAWIAQSLLPVRWDRSNYVMSTLASSSWIKWSFLAVIRASGWTSEVKGRV